MKPLGERNFAEGQNESHPGLSTVYHTPVTISKLAVSQEILFRLKESFLDVLSLD
jgi:hypothetical protein